jgi:alpha-L-fucosidase
MTLTLMKPTIPVLAMLMASLAAGPLQAESPASNPPQNESAKEKRLAWWKDAKFGLFIHWGLYSDLAGEWKGGYYAGIGEWIMYKARIPLAEYEGVAAKFNPVKFDADAWAQLAKDAGMKYVIITAKHHDGFAMFDSKADKFNIVDATPFKRDPIKELAAACAKRGLKFGVYYSQAQDWHAPGGAIWKGEHEADPIYEIPEWDERQKGDFEAYFNNKAIPQVRELLTNYGPIGVVWFDTPLGVMNTERAAKLEKVVRELQPDALVSGRLSKEFQADYDSAGDNEIPNLSQTGAWETPATLNHTWGFKKHDHHWKTPANVIFKLVDIVSKGGNYLLNIGPDGQGVIPQPSIEVLEGVGRWMKVNGEAIYGASPSPFGAEFGTPIPPPKAGSTAPPKEWRCDVCGANQKNAPKFEPSNEWRCTTKPGKMFITIFDWPENGKFQMPAVKEKITKAYLLADPQQTALKATQSDTGVSLALPEKAPDSIASVVCLETQE